MVSKELSSPHIKCQVPHIRLPQLPKHFEYPPLMAAVQIDSVSSHDLAAMKHLL